jgi:hypothetical protein
LHQFHISFCGSATNDNSPRDANEIGILKFHSRALPTIVQKGIDP